MSVLVALLNHFKDKRSIPGVIQKYKTCLYLEEFKQEYCDKMASFLPLSIPWKGTAKGKKRDVPQVI